MPSDAEPKDTFTDWRERSESWRRRAEQLQLIANGMADIGARNALLRQARQWQRMAEEAEQLAAQWRGRQEHEEAHKH
ncbi:MAG: hypothetical protein AB7E79_03260 [Rhodospirillaceae bacterium]